jgi:hypothetical protein
MRKQQKLLRGTLQYGASIWKLILLSREPAVLVYHLRELIVTANLRQLKRQSVGPGRAKYCTSWEVWGC